MNLDPVDNQFIEQIKDNSSTLKDQLNTTQPQFFDWLPINLTYLSYSADNVMSVDSSIIAFFSIGDKVRITQTTTKYFYIRDINTGSGTITLTGGTDYTFTNGTFTAFAYSKLLTPTGFPILFSYNPQISAAVGTYSNLDASEYEVAKFLMTGKLVSLKVDVTFGNLSGGPSALLSVPPFPSDFLTYERVVMSCTDVGTFQAGVAKMGGASSIELYATAALGSFSNTAGNDLGFNFSIEYTAAIT